VTLSCVRERVVKPSTSLAVPSQTEVERKDNRGPEEVERALQSSNNAKILDQIEAVGRGPINFTT
jgi:hypothetical protein